MAGQNSTEQKSSAPYPSHRKHTKGLAQKKVTAPENLSVF